MSSSERIIIVLIIAFASMLSSVIAVSLSKRFTCEQFVDGELINGQCGVIIELTKLKLTEGEK